MTEEEFEKKNEFCGNIIHQLIAIIGKNWNASPDEVEITADNIEYMTQLYYVEFTPFCVRMYCYWDKGLIKVDYLYDYRQKHYAKSKKFRIKHGVLNLEAFDKFIAKSRDFISKKTMPKEKDGFVMDAFKVAASIANNAEYTDKELLEKVLLAWDDLELNQRSKKFKTQMAMFVSFTSYLLRYHKDEFMDYLKQKVDENKQEDKD